MNMTFDNIPQIKTAIKLMSHTDRQTWVKKKVISHSEHPKISKSIKKRKSKIFTISLLMHRLIELTFIIIYSYE